MRFDGVYGYDETKSFVEEQGWDSFLTKLKDEFPNRKLYSVSQSWYDDSQYLCKAKGAKGDVIIGWQEWGGWS